MIVKTKFIACVAILFLSMAASSEAQCNLPYGDWVYTIEADWDDANDYIFPYGATFTLAAYAYGESYYGEDYWDDPDDFEFAWSVDDEVVIDDYEDGDWGSDSITFSTDGTEDFTYDEIGYYTVIVDASIYYSWGYDCWGRNTVDVTIVGVDEVTASCDQEIASSGENMLVPPCRRSVKMHHHRSNQNAPP